MASEFVFKESYGAIWKNKLKKEGERTPDYRGRFRFKGETIEIGLWIKEGANGKYFSVHVQEERPKPNGQGEADARR